MRGSRTVLAGLTGRGHDLTDLDTARIPAHLRQLLRAAPAAILVGLIAGLIAFGVNQSADPAYRAESTAQIDAQIPVVAGDAYLYQNTAPYLTLATSGKVLESVSRTMGPAWSPERVADQTIVSVAQSPLLLDVAATAPSRQEAIDLTQAMIDALNQASNDQRRKELDRAVSSRVAQRRELERRLSSLPAGSDERSGVEASIDALQDQIDRILGAGANGLSALAVPDRDRVAQVAPRSPATAVFIGLIAMLVAAEALVLFGHLGRRLTAETIRQAASARGVPVETTDDAREMPAVTAALVERDRRDDDGGTLIVASAETFDIATAWTTDGADWSTAPTAYPVVGLRDRWPLRLDDDTAHIVFIVSLGEPIRRELSSALGEAEDLGVSTRLVVLPPHPTADPDRTRDDEAKLPDVEPDDEAAPR